MRDVASPFHCINETQGIKKASSVWQPHADQLCVTMPGERGLLPTLLCLGGGMHPTNRLITWDLAPSSHPQAPLSSHRFTMRTCKVVA